MAVPVQTTPAFSHGTPSVLFEGNYHISELARSYDVAADGRFVMIKPVPLRSGVSSRGIQVVLNWAEELERLAPTN